MNTKSTTGTLPIRSNARPDDGTAFLPDIGAHGAARIADDEAEATAEEFIAEATSAEHIADDARDETSPDESGLTLTYDPTLLDEVDLASAGEPRKPARRGFAMMDRERVREIARKGGAAAHRLGKAHRFSSAEAVSAGRKGGLAPHRTRGRSAVTGG